MNQNIFALFGYKISKKRDYQQEMQTFLLKGRLYHRSYDDSAG